MSAETFQKHENQAKTKGSNRNMCEVKIKRNAKPEHVSRNFIFLLFVLFCLFVVVAVVCLSVCSVCVFFNH